MSGTIGVIASDWGRASLFTTSLTTLRSPVNTMLDWALSSDIILGRNKLTERALERGAEWLLFVDDDHCFNNDLLLRLLVHDVPIAGALYLQRMRPFAPVAYIEKSEDETYKPLMLNNYAGDELVKVRALGTGGMLIRSEVLYALEYPWFEHGRASEDLTFCDKVTELGFPIYCDLGARMGHLSPSAIWPVAAPDGDGDESWRIGFSVADGFALQVMIDPADVPEGEVLHDEQAEALSLTPE